MKARIIAFSLLLVLMVFLFSGCVTNTNVRFETSEPGAMVMIDGESIGTTPAQVQMSNAIWEDPDVLIKMEGYKDVRAGVDKEVKGVNLIFGLILWWPSLLWVYGPEANQYYELIPAQQ
ncbi:MAG: PEGA domain-containing protein [Spirochaetales bacterium]|nr:PEGA domain-containing protein [Spirochaetales bacterium]